MKAASSFVRPMNSHLRPSLAGSLALLLGALIPAASAVDRMWIGSDSGILFAPIWDAGAVPGFFSPAAVGAPTIADNVLFPAVVPPNKQLAPPVPDMRLDGSEIILSNSAGFPVAAANITFLNSYLLSQKNTANIAGEVPAPLFLGVGNVTVAATHTAGIDADIFIFGQQLTKLGEGTLLLERTVFGNVVVNEGTLGGNFTATGNLTNSAILAPGNSPGKIKINGSFSQTNSGTLRIEIASAENFDRLEIGKRAKLDGDLDVALLNGYHPGKGKKFNFLSAGGKVSGEFDDVNAPVWDNLTLRAFYEKHRVFLKVVIDSFEAEAETPNQQAVAHVLDAVIDDKRAEKIIRHLYKRDFDDLPGDFDKIAPEELTSIFTSSVALAQVQSTNVQRRTDDLRSGASGFSAAGLAMNGTGPGYNGPIEFRTGMAGPTGNESKESKEVKEVAPPEEKRWGAFLTGVGEWVDVNGDGNARGYDITTGGFTLGLDYKVCPNFAVGVLAGYAGTAADLTNNGRVWVNGGKLGLYATTFTGGWYADVAVTGGLNGYDTKRSALQGTARGSTNGGELDVLAATGYDWKIGALSIGPTASFNYTLVGMNGFTERGSLAPLTIGNRNAESVRSAFGFKASYDWKVGGVVVKPELRASWQHEYGDSSYALDSSFANGAGNAFLVNGPELGRDSLLLGAGFAVQLNERVATYVYYDGELARTRYESNAVSGGVRVAF